MRIISVHRHNDQPELARTSIGVALFGVAIAWMLPVLAFILGIVYAGLGYSGYLLSDVVSYTWDHILVAVPVLGIVGGSICLTLLPRQLRRLCGHTAGYLAFALTLVTFVIPLCWLHVTCSSDPHACIF